MTADSAQGAAGDRAERLAALALYLGLNLNATAWHRTLGYAGSAAAAFEGFDLGLAGVKFPGLLSSGLLEEAAAHLAEAGEKGLRLLILGDDDYPVRLLEIPEPPPVLWIKGSLTAGDRLAAALVGSRAATPGGLAAARRLAREGAERGLTIVSGLALGIDAEAHRGALEGGGRTLAVLGCGLDWVYPKENAWLYDRLPQSGALISEFPPATPPRPPNFPRRNRVLAGLSLAVAVVEAGRRSGALITARLGLELNREVVALPGPAGAAFAEGGNRLIKQGAALVENMDDILAEIKPRLLEGLTRAAPPPAASPEQATPEQASPEQARPEQAAPERPVARQSRPGSIGPAPEPQAPEPPAAGSRERLVWNLLAEGPRDADALGRAAGLSPAEMSLVLLNLELTGLAVKSPAGLFARSV